jgi:hypothetical protein
MRPSNEGGRPRNEGLSQHVRTAPGASLGRADGRGPRLARSIAPLAWRLRRAMGLGDRATLSVRPRLARPARAPARRQRGGPQDLLPAPRERARGRRARRLGRRRRCSAFCAGPRALGAPTRAVPARDVATRHRTRHRSRRPRRAPPAPLDPRRTALPAAGRRGSLVGGGRLRAGTEPGGHSSVESWLPP